GGLPESDPGLLASFPAPPSTLPGVPPASSLPGSSASSRPRPEVAHPVTTPAPSPIEHSATRRARGPKPRRNTEKLSAMGLLRGDSASTQANRGHVSDGDQGPASAE